MREEVEAGNMCPCHPGAGQTLQKPIFSVTEERKYDGILKIAR
jgi:hypothetical protein